MLRQPVVARFGPLQGANRRRCHLKRSRCCLYVVCTASCAFLSVLHLRAHHVLAAESRPPSRLGSPAPSAAPPPSPQGARASSSGPTQYVHLDSLYPPCSDEYWADASQTTAPWLSQLRRQWVDELRQDIDVQLAYATTTGLPMIARKLHQTWKDEHPPKLLFSERWRRNLQDANPGWEYRLWTDADNRQLVAQQYPSLLHTYDNYASAIQRADAARYFIVRQHGGVYLDLDVECFRSFEPLFADASLVLSYKLGGNFSRGAANSIFASAPRHPFWQVVFDVLVNRSSTPLSSHKAVLYSTGPAVLREAVRRLLHLPSHQTITQGMLQRLREQLGMVMLDASFLHPVTAERRTQDGDAERHPNSYCTHHFVSSWVNHSSTLHAETERRRREGHGLAAMENDGQPILRGNSWYE